MPNDKIIREGEKGDEMFFLTEGSVEIQIQKKTGERFTIIKEKGSYFGEVPTPFNHMKSNPY
jgi:CRP-like cAMP-binding protein